jgi:hypothetical protein
LTAADEHTAASVKKVALNKVLLSVTTDMDVEQLRYMCARIADSSSVTQQRVRLTPVLPTASCHL